MNTWCLELLVLWVPSLTFLVFRLGSTLARLKLKGIDGDPHKRWSMWFNSMQREEPHLSLGSLRHSQISSGFLGCQDQVRFFALHRIKPHAPPLVRVPVNSFEFQPCGRTPQAENLAR